MIVRLNGERREVRDDATVATLLALVGLAEATCAVAVNREFVPRRAHERTKLHPDDEIDVVAPMQGG